jgi:adenylyltransferase/sulfurtransferase
MTDSRYSRQERFDPIGEEGQARITNGRVAIIGCGGLGTVIADILVRAGVGFVRIVDRDFIETSNLQRQLLFDEQDIVDGLPKAEAARRKLVRINSTVTIDAHITDVTPGNVEGLIRDVDLVMDGSDNFELRYLLNDAAVSLDKPWIFGAAAGSEGMTMTIIPGKTPCLTCLYPEAPSPGVASTCDTAGVISPVLHVIAAIQSTNALKLLSGSFEPDAAGLRVVDIWNDHFQPLGMGGQRREDCETCAQRHFAHLDATRGSYTTSLCGRNAIQVSWKESRTVDFPQLQNKLGGLGTVETNAFMLRFSSPEARLTVFPDGRTIVEGTDDPTLAREIVSRYIG